MKIALIRVYANSGDGYDCYLDFEYVATSLPEWIEISTEDFDVLLKAKNSGRLIRDGYMLFVSEEPKNIVDYIANMKSQMLQADKTELERKEKLSALRKEKEAKSAEKEKTKKLKQLAELKKELGELE